MLLINVTHAVHDGVSDSNDVTNDTDCVHDIDSDAANDTVAGNDNESDDDTELILIMMLIYPSPSDLPFSFRAILERRKR